MHQCKLNAPLQNDWSKLTYSQAHRFSGSPVPKFFLIWKCDAVASKMENIRGLKLSEEKTFVFHVKKFHTSVSHTLTNTHTHTHTHIHTYIQSHVEIWWLYTQVSYVRFGGFIAKYTTWSGFESIKDSFRWKRWENHSYGRKLESLCLKTIISNLTLK